VCCAEDKPKTHLPPSRKELADQEATGEMVAVVAAEDACVKRGWALMANADGWKGMESGWSRPLGPHRDDLDE
jgi:hypothetical protein